MSKDYYSIRVNTIRGNDVVPFDLFIQVGPKFIHYTRAHDEVEEKRLKTLKNHGLKKLFILPEHESIYLFYLEEGIKSLTNREVNITERASRANDTMLVSVENAEKNLETETGYNNQRKQLELIGQFIGDEREAIKNILSSAGVSLDNNQHSATVSSLCLAIASKLEVLNRDEMAELAYAALLHDIGKNRLKFDHNIPFDKLTPDQKKHYKQHPADGVNMLAGKPFISPRILGLIASHEEYGEGRGYPEKKNMFKMDPSYQILSLANKFDRFCQEKNLAPFNAVDPFFEIHANHYDETLIATLASVLT
jgi:HD-GYP domain-containing protein (c-di-GMP phosphodiesterase class II)